MFQKPFRTLHGWIEDIQPGPESGLYTLELRQEDTVVIGLTANEPDWPLKPGHEVSIAIHDDGSRRAIAIVDHTAGNGAIMPQVNRRRRPDSEDVAISAVVFCAIWLLSGRQGLPVYAATMALYCLATSWRPDAIRQKNEARIAYRLDKDYFLWSKGKR
jgi:hypothetical protein